MQCLIEEEFIFLQYSFKENSKSNIPQSDVGGRIVTQSRWPFPCGMGLKSDIKLDVGFFFEKDLIRRVVLSKWRYE